MSTSKRYRLNFQIRVPDVRLVDEKGQQVGVVSTQEALRMAQAAGLDLVEVFPNAQPPVAKIIDYGAYQYRQEKLERKSKAKQKRVDIKGIRISLNIGKHDLEMRKSQAEKFFEKGDKVLLEMILRGREKAHAARAFEMIRAFARSFGESVHVEQDVSKLGGRLTMLIARKK
ncbi:MAG: translation initiation factor IF-3 [Candidatus Kerfeldbacteria bacterium RIFCSPLOWO2_01_FULL_48_11]|uniref:Translation initiation factor IF-3 n=1 Tax=Candidatus Kerfeldbacteria bacterium RIFCSPLOWO2_01_FULL_48_11 TaxID=1798543 RepID=A0A1G2B391_9BACT|nr:MAG: translation initiation factor IF-3 [Candidatus Kerfeldbacteria bacterium RIFCSPLOWO2_01_FULL_48_11]